MISASALLVLASLLLRDLTLPALCLLVAMVTVSASLWYLPNHLHLHHKPYKRSAWAVRTRWVMVPGISLVAALFHLQDPRWLALLGIAAAWLLVTNLTIMLIYRPGRLSEQTIAVVYFASDLWLAVSMGLAGGHWLIVTGFLILSAHFAVLLFPERGSFWFPMSIMGLGLFLLRNSNPFDSGGFEPAYLILCVAVATGATSVLVYMARTQAMRDDGDLSL